MAIQLQNFSSEIIYVQDMSFVVIGFTMKLFRRIFLNSVIYETFPIQNFLCIYGYVALEAGIYRAKQDIYEK